MLNKIYLRRKQKIILPAGQTTLPVDQLATFLANIESLGYTCSPPLIERLQTLDTATFQSRAEFILQTLREMVGADVEYKPMYPNFPQQVMEAEEAELFVNAMLHYLGDWIDRRIIPVYEKEARSPLGSVKLRVIDLGSAAELLSIGRNLIQSNTALSAADKTDVAAFVADYANNIDVLLPDHIPQKETLAFVSAQLLQNAVADAAQRLTTYCRTATDVLRVATALSDGDVSLSANSRFRSFKRSERRLLLTLLEACGDPTEDMLRHKKRWIRLGERLHPAEYQTRFPRSAEAFNVLRNDKPFATFNSKVEALLSAKRSLDAVILLQNRPGELARRLDHLLRTAINPTFIVEEFATVADNVATPVLLQLWKHFQARNEPNNLRIFFPKGNVGKAQAIANELPPLSAEICAAVMEVAERALIGRFAQLPALETCYLDPQLHNFPIPFSQRSASKALKTLPRASRLPLGTRDTLRFFLYWHEGMVNGTHTGRVDIDLSAIFYDFKWNYLTHVSYTNLRSPEYNVVHSGDITSAPEGAAEFIDMHLHDLITKNVGYVVMSLFAFTKQPFCDLPACYVGWMTRNRPQSGEIFEPSSVANKIDLAANTTICIPVVLDLVEEQLIWTDLALTQEPIFYNNLESNLGGLSLLGYAMTTLNKPTLHDLFSLHITARGKPVMNADAAQTVFSFDQGITPFDGEVITAEFLA
jgi:hypothetical protein